MLKTADINDKCVTEEKLADGSVSKVKLAADIIEDINNTISAVNAATEAIAGHEERIATAEGDIESILSDCAHYVKDTTYNQKVIMLESAIAGHEERIATAEGDIESILSDCAHYVKDTTYNQKVIMLESAIAGLQSKLDEYCTLAKYMALKEQINTDFDALQKRVAALENK